MKTIDFARFDMDSGYVYARLSDGNIILINCTAYEQAYADNMYERSELDYLIYNNPVEYVKLVFDDNPVRLLPVFIQRIKSDNAVLMEIGAFFILFQPAEHISHIYEKLFVC